MHPSFYRQGCAVFIAVGIFLPIFRVMWRWFSLSVVTIWSFWFGLGLPKVISVDFCLGTDQILPLFSSIFVYINGVRSSFRARKCACLARALSKSELKGIHGGRDRPFWSPAENTAHPCSSKSGGGHFLRSHFVSRGCYSLVILQKFGNFLREFANFS